MSVVGLAKGGACLLSDSKIQAMAFCSVCFDAVVEGEGRSTARLTCGHSFHLDCIGSAFNAKGRMECPNCRGIEQGRWLYADACCLKEDSVEDSSFESEIDVYNSAGEPHFHHTPWCPHQGSYEHISLTFEEMMNLGNGYIDPLQASLQNQPICPYLIGVQYRPRHANQTDSFMAFRLHNLGHSNSSSPRGQSHAHHARLARSAQRGSWTTQNFNQNAVNLHPNHRHLTFGVLTEGPQSMHMRFDDGADAGGLSGQFMHNQIDQTMHRHSLSHPASLIRNVQSNNSRTRHVEVSRTRLLPNYHLERTQMSEPTYGHRPWNIPYTQQHLNSAPYVDGVHWVPVGPHMSYGLPAYWWAWTPYETNYRNMAMRPHNGGQVSSALRTTLELAGF